MFRGEILRCWLIPTRGAFDGPFALCFDGGGGLTEECVWHVKICNYRGNA